MILFYGLGVVVALDSGRGERRSQTEPRATVGVRKTVVGSWVAAGDEASRRRGRSGEWYDPFRVELTMGGWGSVGALRGRKAMVLERFGLWNEGDWVHGRLRDRFGALPWVCQSPERERRACPRLRNTNRARPTPRSETNRTGQTPHHAPPTWTTRSVRDTSGGPRAGAWGSDGPSVPSRTDRPSQTKPFPTIGVRRSTVIFRWGWACRRGCRRWRPGRRRSGRVRGGRPCRWCRLRCGGSRSSGSLRRGGR